MDYYLRSSNPRAAGAAVSTQGPGNPGGTTDPGFIILERSVLCRCRRWGGPSRGVRSVLTRRLATAPDPRITTGAGRYLSADGEFQVGLLNIERESVTSDGNFRADWFGRYS